MESVCFSETLASTDDSTQRQNPEEHHHHPHCRENLRSHISNNSCVFVRSLFYVMYKSFVQRNFLIKFDLSFSRGMIDS
jgi:hypothetical protein